MTLVLPIDRPMGQKVALLRLRNNQITAQVLAELERRGELIEPEKADWKALFQARYIVGGLKLMLTPQGHTAAGHIASETAKHWGLHFTWTEEGQRGSSGHKFGCTCGARAHAQRTPNGMRNVMRFEGMHLADVASGRWQAGQEAMAAIFESVAAGRPN